MTLHLVQMVPDVGRLVRWGEDRGFMVGDDLGYTLHACLNAAFPGISLKPFAYLEHFAGNNRPHLVGYSDRSGSDFEQAAAGFGEPQAMAALGAQDLAAKVMPKFSKGQKVGFDLITSPVVRSWERKEGVRTRRTEHDAFIHAVKQVDRSVPLDREEIYCDWLGGRLAEIGADVVASGVTQRRQAQVARRDRSDKDGPTRLVALRSPEVRFQGTVEVLDPDAFAIGLAKGIGRHKAFGRGMLVLRPAM